MNEENASEARRCAMVLRRIGEAVVAVIVVVVLSCEAGCAAQNAEVPTKTPEAKPATENDKAPGESDKAMADVRDGLERLVRSKMREKFCPK